MAKMDGVLAKLAERLAHQDVCTIILEVRGVCLRAKTGSGAQALQWPTSSISISSSPGCVFDSILTQLCQGTQSVVHTCANTVNTDNSSILTSIDAFHFDAFHFPRISGSLVATRWGHHYGCVLLRSEYTLFAFFLLFDFFAV